MPQSSLALHTKKSIRDAVTLIRETHTQELIFPLCGPVGSPIHTVAEVLEDILSNDYGYDVRIIKYSDIIREHKKYVDNELQPIAIGDTKKHSPQYLHIQEMIDVGNLLRKEYGPSILTEIAIKRISMDRNKDEGVQLQHEQGNNQIEYKSRRVCYILDSLKHEDELMALQAVYGDLLYFFGVFSPTKKRIEFLRDNNVTEEEIPQLMNRDSGEELAHGQHMRTTFTKADFFLRIDSKDRDLIKRKLERFLDLVFETKQVTPTTHETAMYLASSAAGNSACLSRQVGAALTDEKGEILSVGWNDVPMFGGDLYKAAVIGNAEHEKDERCFKKDMGFCSNDKHKHEMKDDIVRQLIDEGLVDASQKSRAYEVIKKTRIDSLLEFSRAIHAEMHAIIMGAQKSGRKMINGKLFCTTFPCHICARHIVVAGIKEVYYIEPYTKSLTTKLHADAITEDESEDQKVRIRMFDGVAPSKYLQLFRVTPNSRKKDGSGTARSVPCKQASPKTTSSLERIPSLESIVVENLAQRLPNA